MNRLWKRAGLSLSMFALFTMFFVGQTWVGWHDDNDYRTEHQLEVRPLPVYLTSGEYLEATMENWESEFLQMFVYVLFTAFLYQRGSSESKPPDQQTEVDRDPRLATHADAPWPVRRGGWVLVLYENSLSLAFLILFLLAFWLHAVGGRLKANAERLLHNEPAMSLWQYLHSSQFWFESLQNWQSEFLAMWSMVVFSIYLRQRGSPESKPVDCPHHLTPDEIDA